MMMRAAIYTSATGQIQRVVSGPAEIVALQAGEGEEWIEVDAGVSDGTHHVAGGALVVGALDLRTLEQRKADRWGQMKAARTAAIDAPLSTPYGIFDSGPADRTNITDAVLVAQTLTGLGQPVAIAWTLADNTTATLDAGQMVTVGLLLGAKVQAAHARGRVVREAIEAAATAAEVEAVAWDA